jgi:putative Ca2+/H+ antiporter (TMEM165/GDT1 family)
VEAFLVSAGIVAVAEIGDKTQLLALALAMNFRKPVPIILGMLASTLLSRAVAAALGTWLAVTINPGALRWILCLSFIGIAMWVLLPDKGPVKLQPTPRCGIFATTLFTFFLLEMGDKTQIATLALAAKYGSPLAIMAGSTLGSMLVDIPVVILGAAGAQRLSWRPMRILAPALLLGLGVVSAFAGPVR